MPAAGAMEGACALRTAKSATSATSAAERAILLAAVLSRDQWMVVLACDVLFAGLSKLEEGR